MSLSILAVVPLPPWRTGAARVCATLIEGLVARGHRVRALAATTPDAPLATGVSADVTWFRVPFFEPFIDLVSDEYRRAEGAEIQRWLRAGIAAERPDVLFVGREIYGLHVAPVAQDTGIPSLLICHGGPTTLVARGVWPAAETRRLLSALRQIDVVVTPAHHWAEALRRKGLSGVRVIPNPIDLACFAPGPADPALARRLALAPDDVTVLHASNLQGVKRPMDLVASADRALREDSRLVYLVAGDGPQRATMEDACRRLGLSERFRFLGWVDHRDMPALLNLADIVVMMSDHETQSMVYLEAQACGRALLASDVPGAREVVRDGETGVLFPTGDKAALAELTLKLADAAAWRVELGRQARAAVATHTAPDVVSLYEETLEVMARG